jgi:hypothetical protein
MPTLTPADFPLMAIGPYIYRRTQSSPWLTAPDYAAACDVAARLNRDQQAAYLGGYVPAHQPVYG